MRIRKTQVNMLGELENGKMCFLHKYYTNVNWGIIIFILTSRKINEIFNRIWTKRVQRMDLKY